MKLSSQTLAASELPRVPCSLSISQEMSDLNRIRYGGGYRLALTEIADNGRISFGGGYRLAVA